ncbi:unnamed protein product [Symbiodinium pilosum]|uniref:EF-hand domain-containing protein n=1 Tax=Symbiodinium pilosum TaxID=2952 RepID=A0A812N2G2_SYMPI|nr:unnamed protein product [Symbiodinium pilosum]
MAREQVQTCNSQDSQSMRQELEELLKQCPLQIAKSLLRAAKAAFDAQRWRERFLEAVRQHAKEAAASGAVVPLALEEEVRQLHVQQLLHQAKELKLHGDKVQAQTTIANYESAAESYAAALRLLELLQDAGADADASSELRELPDALHALAVQAMDQVESALGEEPLAEEAGDEVEKLLAFADRILSQSKDPSSSLRVELQALQEAAAEAKISGLRSSGDAAAERGDWQEADACWASAMLIAQRQEPTPGILRLSEGLVKSRRFAAVTMAGAFLQQGDASRAAGDIFNADKRYSDALGVLTSEDAGTAPLRCMVLLKRAEVLHQKWQHKDALDDCVAALRMGFERPRALCLAAEACRALYLREAKEDLLESNIRSHWMEMAVRYLEEACAEQEDPALQRRLRAWRREAPPRPTPVPMPPFDWSKVPKNEKANYFGYVDRRVRFNEMELQRIWEEVSKESKVGQEAVIGKAAFVRALKRFSGDIEEEEADALFQEADQDQDGWLAYADFRQIMQMDHTQ